MDESSDMLSDMAREDIPEPIREEFEKQDRKIEAIKQDHGSAIEALQVQYERMEENQRAILEKIGEMPTKDDIRVAVAEGVVGVIRDTINAVPAYAANRLQYNNNQTNLTATFWFKVSAVAGAVMAVWEILKRHFGFH